MPSPEEKYESEMRDARDTVFLVAVRRAIDTRLIDVEFDAGRGPGPHKTHDLLVSVRGSAITASSHNIPHEWLATGTGFIDTRLSKLTASLISELTAKAHQAGLSLE
jgi:hypothetical protein